MRIIHVLIFAENCLINREQSEITNTVMYFTSAVISQSNANLH